MLTDDARFGSTHEVNSRAINRHRNFQLGGFGMISLRSVLWFMASGGRTFLWVRNKLGTWCFVLSALCLVFGLGALVFERQKARPKYKAQTSAPPQLDTGGTAELAASLPKTDGVVPASGSDCLGIRRK